MQITFVVSSLDGWEIKLLLLFCSKLTYFCTSFFCKTISGDKLYNAATVWGSHFVYNALLKAILRPVRAKYEANIPQASMPCGFENKNEATERQL